MVPLVAGALVGGAFSARIAGVALILVWVFGPSGLFWSSQGPYPRNGNFVPAAFKRGLANAVLMAAPAHPYRRPLLALTLLSPFIAEMLSGSSPPLEWLNPVAALLLIWLYGSGVLAMRQTAVRGNTGWPSVLLLGAAYGIIEEGLAVKSFFDPGWMDLGTLGWY